MVSACKTPKELDWVTERSNCTVFKVFQQLRVEVEKDVEKREASPQGYEQSLRIRFDLQVHTPDCFSVMREGIGGVLSSVQFRLDGDKIAIRDGQNATVMTALLGLNDAGECVLKLDGDKDSELWTWQFRRRALEHLFFDVPTLHEASARK